jgi:hypothetical protein
MTADAAPVLAYDRPLAPGMVRITRSSATVVVKIAPDTAKRALSSLLIPALLFLFAGGVVVSALSSGGGLGALVIAVVLLGIGGAMLHQTLRQSRDPIVFTADPRMLRIENSLDVPPDRTVGVFEIETLQLRRHPLIPSAYGLEVLTRGFPDRPRTAISLLVSPSFETLDKIGRTLAEAMRLNVCPGPPEGWRTDGHSLAADEGFAKP